MAATDARPVCRKGVAWRLYFALRTSAGALYTSWAAQDSEVSLDGASFADCTNEATEIGTSGCGYLDLTGSETNADCIVLKIATTGGLTAVFTVFPEEAGDYRADVTHWSGTAVATPDTAGYPKVTHKSGTGAGEIALTSGGVTLAAATHTGAVIPTVTTLTNLPSIPAGWLTATGIAASALNGKGDWNTTTPPTVGAISTQVASDLATAHGSGSWATATGFSTLTAADIRTAVGMASANLDTQLSAIKTDTAVARSAGVVQIGTISNAGTQVESYTYGGQTVTFAGLDSSGNRSGVTVT